MTSSIDIRTKMVSTLRRDLIGPGLEDTDLEREVLPARPSRWYLTGFLVPVQAPTDQRTTAASTEGALDSGEGADGLDGGRQEVRLCAGRIGLIGMASERRKVADQLLVHRFHETSQL